MSDSSRRKMQAKSMGGRKLLYSQLYQSVDLFWGVYDKEWYDGLRQRYVTGNGIKTSVPDIHQKLMLQTQ